ncbi:hypothetical protein EJB05_30955, partial [Eragrostis curvula]
MDVHGITDDLLKLILLRIDSPIHLLRAASTCKRLYRIVAGSGFLHSFRSIHGPPPVAYVYFKGNQEVSRYDFDSSYFCLDFLPHIRNSSVGQPKDLRASLVLLERVHHVPRYHQDWVVCEPLSRRYQIIPPISPSGDGPNGCWRHTWAFLLDGNDGIGISNFKSWPTHLRLIGFAEDSVYWRAEGKTLLAVDRRTAKLEWFLFPHVENLDYTFKSYKVAVTGGSDGEGRIVVGGNDGDMMVYARQRGSSEWVMEKRIHISPETHGLPPYHDWYFYCAMSISVHKAGTVIVRVFPKVPAGEKWRIDLDRETVGLLDCMPKIRFPCELPWPPMLRDY